MEAINKLLDIMDKKFTGLCMVILNDFDSNYGHNRDVEGYQKALEELDVEIPIILNKLEMDDLLGAIGASIADNFNIEKTEIGISVLDELE